MLLTFDRNVRLLPSFLVLSASLFNPAVLALAQDAPHLLQLWCVDCHRDSKSKGDINFERLAEQSVSERITTRAILDRALGQIERQEMPPETAHKQPSAVERAALTKWLQQRIENLDRNTPVQAGRVTMRRLNRFEYRKTIHDLTGLDFDLYFDPTSDFPDDGTGHGFDSIGSVLATSPLLMERYVIAANEILRRALVLDGIDTNYTWSVTGKDLPFIASDPQQNTDIRTGMWAGQFIIPQAGDYKLRVRLVSDREFTDSDAAMAWEIDDLRPQQFTWQRTKQAKIIERRLHLTAGQHQIGVSFIGEMDGKEIRNPLPNAGNINAELIEVNGPVGITLDNLPHSHKRIISVRPSAQVSRIKAAHEVLATFARKAFRRPVTNDELKKLMDLFSQSDTADISFERALCAPLSAILVSPHFLFRIEPDRPVVKGVNAFALNSHEIATRLSYFLWSTMPDEQLRAVADSGKLTDTAVISEQVRRMLADAKSTTFPARFVPQWLQILRVETVMPDKKSAGNLGTDLRRALLAEPVLLFQHVLRNNLPISELLAPKYTFLNEELAKLYDLDDIKDPEHPTRKGKKDPTLRLTPLTDPVRGGIITMGAVLTASSYPDRTSAVRRGKFILEAVLGAAPPPPPPDVQPLPDDHQDGKGTQLTLRQRLEQHRADSICAGCHARMDPLGFGLENFNPIGKWRDKDGKQTIDASGTLPDGRSFNGPVELKKIIMERQDDVARCLIEKLLTYALGRGMEASDARTITEIAAANKKNNYPLADIIVAICLSTPFRFQGAP